MALKLFQRRPKAQVKPTDIVGHLADGTPVRGTWRKAPRPCYMEYQSTLLGRRMVVDDFIDFGRLPMNNADDDNEFLLDTTKYVECNKLPTLTGVVE